MILDRQKVTGDDALLDNWIDCRCGRQSPHSRDWWVVQEWLREHGYGRAC